MLIHYVDADDCVVELEVTEEVGNFYLASLDYEKNNNRRETRRHILLSAIDEYEDRQIYDSGIDICGDIATSDAVTNTVAKLTERERYLIIAVHREGRTYTEIAKAEDKYPSTIMRETKKAEDKFKRIYAESG